jgi:AcrR family transcriptional regulator
MKRQKVDKTLEQPVPARRRGRPVSGSVDRALAKAAVDEFVQRGYHAMSMESIAARAGVSKLSLYRRWNSKLAVTTEVFRILKDAKTLADQGSLEADIRFLVRQSTGSPGAKSAARLLMRTMGEISDSPELMASRTPAHSAARATACGCGAGPDSRRTAGRPVNRYCMRYYRRPVVFALFDHSGRP